MLHFFVSHFFFSLDFFRMIILFSLICINYSITKNCLIDCNNNFSKVDQKKKGNFLVLNNFYYFLNFFFLKKNKITLCLIKFLFGIFCFYLMMMMIIIMIHPQRQHVT